MSNWRAFPRRTWSQIGNLISASGKGEGAYGTSYAMHVGAEPVLNGRVSARFRIAKEQHVYGAGLVARADAYRSYLAFYYSCTEGLSGELAFRLATFKEGKLAALVGSKQAIRPRESEAVLSLQFFSGLVVGEAAFDETEFKMEYVLPAPPFPGFCGLIRFYNSPVVAREFKIETIRSEPVLGSKPAEGASVAFEYDVFLSYSTQDRVKIDQICARFRQSGVRYWVDHEQIRFGDQIVQKIEDGLRGSRHVVACLSERQAKSGWSRAEYGAILHREFSGDTSRRVIPLTLDGPLRADSVPILLSDVLRADYTNPDSFSSFIAFLLDRK